MPAAAVIPAPIAYINVAAVKKLVVGSRVQACGSARADTARPDLPAGSTLGALNWVSRAGRNVYFEKIRVFKAGGSPE